MSVFDRDFRKFSMNFVAIIACAIFAMFLIIPIANKNDGDSLRAGDADTPAME